MRAYANVLCLMVVIAAGIAGVAGEETAAAVPEPVVVDGKIVRSDDLSTPALVICFRECLEGCVIVSVLLNMLHKAGLNDMKKWVWLGVAISVVTFVIMGAVAIIVWYQIQATVPNSGRAAFEGVLAVIACSVLTMMAFKFLRLKDLMFKWENKLFKKEGSEGSEPEAAPPPSGCIQTLRDMMHIKHQQIAKDEGEVSPKLLLILTFSAIFREGLETVIFLLPMSTGTSEIGLLKGSLAGCAAGIGFGIFVLAVGKYMLVDVTWFFNLTTAFILAIAAGLSNYAIIELEQIDKLPALARNDPIILRPMYNIGCTMRHPTVDVNCFLDEATGAGLVFRALLGYRAAPTFLQCLGYLFYWQVVILVIVLRYKKGTLFSRNGPQKPPKVQRAVALEEGGASPGAVKAANQLSIGVQQPVIAGAGNPVYGGGVMMQPGLGGGLVYPQGMMMPMSGMPIQHMPMQMQTGFA